MCSPWNTTLTVQLIQPMTNDRISLDVQTARRRLLGTMQPWKQTLETHHRDCWIVISFNISHQAKPCWLPKTLLSQNSAVLISRRRTLSAWKELPPTGRRINAEAFVIECRIVPRTIPSTKPCWLPWKTVRRRNAALSSVLSRNQLELVFLVMWPCFKRRNK